MRWHNHIIVTGGLVQIFTGDILISLITSLGSVLPDKLEGKPPDSRKDYKGYWKWRSNHRKFTHWFLPYLLSIFGIKFLIWSGEIEPDLCFIGDFFIYFFCGALLHIFEDSLCGKVPVFNLKPKKGFGLELFKVGGFGEFLYSCFLLFGAYVIKNYVLNFL